MRVKSILNRMFWKHGFQKFTPAFSDKKKMQTNAILHPAWKKLVSPFPISLPLNRDHRDKINPAIHPRMFPNNRCKEQPEALLPIRGGKTQVFDTPMLFTAFIQYLIPGAAALKYNMLLLNPGVDKKLDFVFSHVPTLFRVKTSPFHPLSKLTKDPEKNSVAELGHGTPTLLVIHNQ